MALIKLNTYESRMEAEIVRGRLASEGIPAILFDDGLASLGIGSLTPVRLMVDESDEQAAKVLLGLEEDQSGS